MVTEHSCNPLVHPVHTFTISIFHIGILIFLPFQDSRNPLSPMPCISLCGTKKQSTMVAVGDKFPTAPVVHHEGFGGNTPSAIKTVGDMLGDNKKVLFVTLPGAFTPT